MILRRFVAVLLVLSAIISHLDAAPIKFETGAWKDVLIKAKKEKKRIFVDAYATWCGPCKKMAATTFVNDSVGNFYNKYFVCYKIDMESPEGLLFGKDFPVSSYPTFLFFDQNGKKISEQKGYREPSNFLKIGRGVIFPELTEMYQLTKQYESGKRDKKFLYKYLMAKNDENQKPDAKLLDEYFLGIAPDSLLSAEPFVIYYLFHDSLESVYTLFFIKEYKRITEIYGNYALTKVDNLINTNIEIAASRKDKAHLEKVKKFASNFIEASKMPGIEQQIDKAFLMQLSKTH